MFSWLLYYVVLVPLSWLPLSILYIISKLIYLALYYIIGYRKSVVKNNLKLSFPEKSSVDLDVDVKMFYKHLSNLLAESIKNLAISEKKLAKRLTVVNPELMDRFYNENKSVILIGSHIYNWEFLITAQNFLFKHQAIGIGTPLSNSLLNNKINKRRGRFGMKIVNSENYKAALQAATTIPTATLILGDQSPSNSNNAYWTQFLNQPTAFFFGAEIMANQMNSAVVYCQMTLQKKGYYSITLKEITSKPKETEYGTIIKNYVELLEKDIVDNPAYWLWSHKRWKIKVPENIDELKANHKQRFEGKFRSQIK